MEDLNHVVFENLTVENINSKVESTSRPLFFIKSTFIKTSNGQGLYNYYKNVFYKANHDLLENNYFNINGLTCSLVEEEVRGQNLNNNYSVIIRTEIVDRVGITKRMNFYQDSLPQKRFKSLFEYIKLLDRVDTHKAFTYVESKNKEILYLQNKLSKK